MAVRRTARDEQGTIVKRWTNRVPLCVVFPNSYYVGMSNLAVHLLYRLLNGFDEIVCERAFHEGEGPPASVESKRPLRSFEILFFTLSFEMDYVNIPRMLKAAGIAPLSADRGEGDPIVVGGGMCAMANPEPLSPFFDLLVLGDAEATLPDFAARYLDIRDKAREAIVDALGMRPWVYDPAQLRVRYGPEGPIEAFEPADYQVIVERYRGKRLARSVIVTEGTEFSDTMLLEGSRGCPSACPFCLTGCLSGFTHDDLTDIEGGTKDVGIIGGGISYHPALADIVRRLKGQGIRVHLPSLRVDEVPLEVIELIKDDVKTLTFGIEAATERLRRFIGKPLSDDDIGQKVEAIAAIKPFHLKLYFMVGLYGETRDDVEAIVGLSKHLMHLMIKAGSRRGSVGSLTVHASPFVPKASTPFQWLPMEEGEELKTRLGILERGLRRADNTYFTHESVKFSLLQALFARGDRRIAPIILRLSEGNSPASVLRESPLNPSFYVHRLREQEERFPWDFIGGWRDKGKLYQTLLGAVESGKG